MSRRIVLGQDHRLRLVPGRDKYVKTWGFFGMVRRVLAAGLALGLLLSISACSGHSANDISLPASSSDFADKNFQDVANDLHKVGFTSVETKPLGDLITGWVHKDGSVKEVAVDGDSGFSTDSSYPRNVKIVVSYHSFPQDGGGAADTSATKTPIAVKPVEPKPAPAPSVRPVREAEARWLEIMMVTKPSDLIAQAGYDPSYAPLDAIQPGWGGSTDDYLRIRVQEPLDDGQVKRLGINVLNLIGPDFPNITGVIFTDSNGIDHNFFRSEAPGADLKP